ncbi:Trichothecene biosynthesis protein 14 [Cladobotryum mycophilum]|uniref:Trichothecene biosynthesis protein 14 n=1 Tax=Cladobotryum mycophilum TaxID=491253 RepID=A0ABR0SY98_9HYPO
MLALLLLPLASLAASSPVTTSYNNCAPISGNFTIHSPNLYPESADFDSKRCLTYISNLYINTVSAYDANKKIITDTMKMPGITGNPDFHTSGIRIDAPRDQLSIIVSGAQAWLTSGKNISGDNFLVKYDLKKNKVNWQYNLTTLGQGIYGGFQDVVHDRLGNSFVLGTYSSSIIKVSADGKSATPWYYNSARSDVDGFTGLVAYQDEDLLLVTDDEKGQILRFDLRAEKGKPVHVPLQAGAEPIGSNMDGAYSPWTKAEKLGTIVNAYAPQATSSTSVVEIGQRLYVVTEFWDGSTPGKPLDRTEFPFRDITDEVKKLLL